MGYATVLRNFLQSRGWGNRPQSAKHGQPEMEGLCIKTVFLKG